MSFNWTAYLPAFVRDRLQGESVRKVAKNTGWLFADRVLRMGVALLVNVWVARYLGPANFGLLSYATAFVTLFSAFATLGLDGIVVRNIVRDPSAKDEILGTAFFLKLAGAMSMVLLVVSGVVLLRSDDRLVQLIVAITALGSVFQSFDVIDLWFQSQVRAKFIVYAKSIAFLVASLTKVVLILNKASVVAFAVVGIVEIALGAAGMLVVYRLQSQRISGWKPRKSMALLLLRDSWPLILSDVVGMIYLRIDQVMLGQMVGSAEVGVYSAAVRIAEVWYFVPTAIYASVLPAIVEAKSVSDELFYQRLQKVYNVMAFVGYAVAIPATFLAPWVIDILFGETYKGAAPMLALLVWAGMFTALGVGRSAFLMTMNWTRVHFFTVFLGSIANVILNLILIPRYGGMGAVIASFVAYWLAAHGSCFFYRPLFRTGAMLTRALAYPKFW